MKILIGLGNPGEKYQNNRHNAGHMFVDYINEQIRSSKSEVRNNFKTLKTDTFMNTSGIFVKKHAPHSKLDSMYIVHDDLDIPLGKFKIQFGTGPKLHNGIISIEEELGTNEFWRVRIGVDNRTPPGADQSSNWIDGETYSLQDFSLEEIKRLQLVFENIYKQLTP